MYPGQMHGFISFFNMLPSGNKIVEMISEKVRAHAAEYATVAK